jgi:hypothetical protein
LPIADLPDVAFSAGARAVSSSRPELADVFAALPSLKISISETDPAIGALTEGGGAQRPLTYCDSYRLPDMLLVAYWPELRAVGF